jgi:membrane protein YdbS with pleckstrin-like domain
MDEVTVDLFTVENFKRLKIKAVVKDFALLILLIVAIFVLYLMDWEMIYIWILLIIFLILLFLTIIAIGSMGFRTVINDETIIVQTGLMSKRIPWSDVEAIDVSILPKIEKEHILMHLKGEKYHAVVDIGNNREGWMKLKETLKIMAEEKKIPFRT